MDALEVQVENPEDARSALHVQARRWTRVLRAVFAAVSIVTCVSILLVQHTRPTAVARMQIIPRLPFPTWPSWIPLKRPSSTQPKTANQRLGSFPEVTGLATPSPLQVVSDAEDVNLVQDFKSDVTLVAPANLGAVLPRRSEAPSFDSNGGRYRQAAVAVVFNQRGEVLLGERLTRPGEWQFPQGGMEVHENIASAAARELYEETGLGKDARLKLVQVLPFSEECTYTWECGHKHSAEYTISPEYADLYDGQILQFALFYFSGSEDAATICNLDGLGGEEAEFSKVRWSPLSDAVSGVWPCKKPAYEYLKRTAEPRIDRYLNSAGAWHLIT